VKSQSDNSSSTVSQGSQYQRRPAPSLKISMRGELIVATTLLRRRQQHQQLFNKKHFI